MLKFDKTETKVDVEIFEEDFSNGDVQNECKYREWLYGQHGVMFT